MQFEITTETVITEAGETPAKKEPSRLAGALKRIGLAVAKVAAVIALVAFAIGVVAGLYLLVGWLLAVLTAYITGGFLTITALQGAAVLLTINILTASLRASLKRV